MSIRFSTKRLSQRRATLPAAVLALALAVSGGATAASAAPLSPSDAEQIVADFLSDRPVPTNKPGSTAEEYETFKHDIAAIWTDAPWAAVYAQWGCTFISSEVTWTTDETGSPAPSLSQVSNCDQVPAEDAEQAGILRTRTDAVAESKTEAGTSARNAEASNSEMAAAASGNDCGWVGSFELLCIGSDSTGTVFASAQNNAVNQKNQRATVRLGFVGAGQPCALGTLKSTKSGSYNTGDKIKTSSTTNVNSQWSSAVNQYGSYATKYCGVA